MSTAPHTNTTELRMNGTGASSLCPLGSHELYAYIVFARGGTRERKTCKNMKKKKKTRSFM